jgi:hypothetical protein
MELCPTLFEGQDNLSLFAATLFNAQLETLFF